MNSTSTNITPNVSLAAYELGMTADGVLTKTCRKCGKTMPITSFSRSHKSKDGYMHICKECYHPIAVANLTKAHMALEAKSGCGTYRQGVKKTLSLNDFTDSQLAAELTRRGYKGDLSKSFTLSI